MERGVVVGGLLIAGSLLLALALNRSALEESESHAPAVAPAPQAEQDNCSDAVTPESVSGACAAGCEQQDATKGHEAAAGCNASAASCARPCSSRTDVRRSRSRLHP
jgi:hypothetical protein